MIIKSILLKNFRQFTNEQKINFSINNEKKVSLIIGDNTAGKTTILEAFSWCFYGRCNFSIVNASLAKDLNVGKFLDVIVEVNLIHLSKEYIIRRKHIYKKNGLRTVKDREEFSIDFVENGAIIPVRDDHSKLMNDIVPEDLFEYFFFKGENIVNIGKEISDKKSNKQGEFVKAIKGLLGFNFMYEAQDHMDRVIKEYSREVISTTNDDFSKKNTKYFKS